METLKIACRGADVLPLADILEFQGELKSLSKESYMALRLELEQTGFSAPIHVWKDGGFFRCIDGHQRIRVLKSMKESGLWDIPPLPVVFVDAQNKDEAKRRVLQMISQYGKIETQGLYEFVHDMKIDYEEFESRFRLPEIDMEAFKLEYFSTENVSFNATTGVDEDEVPEVKEIAQTQLGDIYIMGNHRLLCGDSTSIDTVEKLMAGEKADMVFTDPPYGMNLDTDYAAINKSNRDGLVKGNTYKPVIGDDADFNPEILLNHFEYVEEMFLWGADYYRSNLPHGGSWFVWDKRNDALKDAIGNDFELCWSKSKHKRLVFRHLWSGFTARERDEKRTHPTQKPIALVDWFFDLHGTKNDKVVDLFGGSGSTLIACEKTNRRCFMMELSPAYCDVIVARWEKYTGKTAELQRKPE